MTLRDVHDDKTMTLLADYLGLKPFGQNMTIGKYTSVTVPENDGYFRDRVEKAWSEHCHKTDPRKTQTHAGMIRECIQKEYKTLSKGPLDECLRKIVEARPDRYTAPKGQEPVAPPAPTPVVVPERKLVAITGEDLVAAMKLRKLKIADLADAVGLKPADVKLARRFGSPDGQPWFAALDRFPIPVQQPKRRNVIAKVAAAMVWFTMLIMGVSRS